MFLHLTALLNVLIILWLPVVIIGPYNNILIIGNRKHRIKGVIHYKKKQISSTKKYKFKLESSKIAFLLERVYKTFLMY